MEERAIISDKSLIVKYFKSCFSYGSLFILSDSLGEIRVVSEVKYINDEFDELAIVPLGEERLSFDIHQNIYIVNEANNISFETKALKNHASKWITIALPESLSVLNLRKSTRYIPSKNLFSRPKVTSCKDDGISRKFEYEGEIIDISVSGVAFRIANKRLDGLYRGDQVEIKISEKISSLSQVKGRIVHKSISNINDPDKRFIKIGIQFLKLESIDQLLQV